MASNYVCARLFVCEHKITSMWRVPLSNWNAYWMVAQTVDWKLHRWLLWVVGLQTNIIHHWCLCVHKLSHQEAHSSSTSSSRRLWERGNEKSIKAFWYFLLFVGFAVAPFCLIIFRIGSSQCTHRFLFPSPNSLCDINIPLNFFL